MPAGVKILTKLWLLFFMVTIVVIGVAFCVPIYFPLRALSRVFPRLGDRADQVIHTGIELLMRVQPWFKGDIQIELPKNHSGGLLLVSNHRSHLDVFILLSHICGIRVLAKSVLFRIPGLGVMMRATGQIGVERGRPEAWVQAMEEVRRRLRAGETVHVFPEMTRCPPGFQGVGHFAAAPFLAAVQENATVIPIVFRGTDQVWPRDFAGLNFRRPVVAKSLAPLLAADFASVRALKDAAQSQIVEALS